MWGGVCGVLGPAGGFGGRREGGDSAHVLWVCPDPMAPARGPPEPVPGPRELPVAPGRGGPAAQDGGRPSAAGSACLRCVRSSHRSVLRASVGSRPARSWWVTWLGPMEPVWKVGGGPAHTRISGAPPRRPSGLGPRKRTRRGRELGTSEPSPSLPQPCCDRRDRRSRCPWSHPAHFTEEEARAPRGGGAPSHPEAGLGPCPPSRGPLLPLTGHACPDPPSKSAFPPPRWPGNNDPQFVHLGGAHGWDKWLHLWSGVLLPLAVLVTMLVLTEIAWRAGTGSLT